MIFREHFKHPLVVDLEESKIPKQISTFTEDGKQFIFANYYGIGYYLNYHRNNVYYLKYPMLAIFYVIVSFLIHFIYRLQKFRAERDYQAKRKMNELQILSLKNQIEPHFTFNILNSIGSLYTRNKNPDLAYNICVKYSNLLRSTIKNSDKVSIPIREELDFVNTYVELEQFRSGHAFNYQVDIDSDADLSIHIPRLLIHTFVENAIKHGIRMVKEDALLELKISRNKNSQQILIRDNGPGYNSESKNKAAGTGKGLRIVDEMLNLFYQLEGGRISYRLEDNSGRNLDQNGTQVLITIQV